MYYNSSVCPLTHKIHLIIKKNKIVSINDPNVGCLIWNFCYSLFMGHANKRHSQRQNYNFRIQEVAKRVNASKFSCRKFDPKIIRSQPYIGK